MRVRILIITHILIYFLLLSCTNTYLRDLKQYPIDKTQYQLEVYFEENELKLTAKQKILIKDWKTMDKLIFNIWLNTYREGMKGMFYPIDLEYGIFPPGDSQGWIDIISVKVNNMAIDYTIDNTLLIINLNEIKHTNTLEIELEFVEYIPHIYHRSGSDGRAVWLGNWIPTLGVKDDDKWYVYEYFPCGDPFYTQIADYQVKMNTPIDYIVAGTGVETETITGGRKITELTAYSVRDHGLAMSKSYKKLTTVYNNRVKCNLYTHNLNMGEAFAYMAEIEKIMAYYERLIGPYPYPELDIMETVFMTGGMEYPTMVMISSWSLGDYPRGKVTVLHEIGHQWFYGLIGNNQVTDAWFDEGLVTFLQKMYELEEDEQKIEQYYQKIKQEIDDDADKSHVTSLLSDVSMFNNWNSYAYTHYKIASLMQYEIYKQMGREKYYKLLKEMYNRYIFKTMGKSEFMDLVIEIGGEYFKKLFAEYFH